MRAILRKPELLIPDEATANIDTVTEQQPEAILNNLPESTTKVIIAHRMNNIENTDEIFIVNSGKIVAAGSFDEALSMQRQVTSVSEKKMIHKTLLLSWRMIFTKFKKSLEEVIRMILLSKLVF